MVAKATSKKEAPSLFTEEGGRWGEDMGVKWDESVLDFKNIFIRIYTRDVIVSVFWFFGEAFVYFKLRVVLRADIKNI